jgi:rhamnosyltransferase
MAGRGLHWVLLFDQDSEPAPDMSERLIETLQRHPAPGRVAIVGPIFRDPTTGRRHRVLRQQPRWPWFFQKVSVAADDLPAVSMVITSGSLLRVADFDEVGPFDEGFFIDYVDTDFCLRCRRHGRLIAVSAAARLDHSMGRRETRRWFGFKVQPTNHSALRHYYIARNRLPMIRRHAWREPHWFFFECAAAMLWVFRVLAAEDHKPKKIQAMLLGTWDGLKGRRGACPENRRRQLRA